MLTLTRIVLPPVALSLLLAGCAGGDDEPGDETGAAGATRTVEHARGSTEVPESPQRVVVLEPVQLDTAVALGRTPVGAAVLDEATGVPAYLGEAADISAIESTGTVVEPNLERIAALQPDLVIGTESRHAALYDDLSALAPTVFMASQEDDWQDNAALVAEALGAAAQLQQLLADYEGRCAEIAEEHGTEGTTAQLVRPRDGLLSLYGPTSFAGSTLECAGFTTPERDFEDSISVDVSLELAREAQADLVLVTTTDVDDPATLPSVFSEDAAAFPSLRLVDSSSWITGVGPLGGLTVLDDLDGILTDAAR